MQSWKTLLCLLAFLSIVGCGKKDNKKIKSKPIVDQNPEPEGLKVMGEVPSFELVDQDGQLINRSAFEGKVWVATFIFTRCGATCPTQTAEMKKLQKELKLASDLDKVKLASFTVDPEFDTPEVMKAYGTKSKADFENWKFITGERGDLWDLSKSGFKVDVKSGRDEPSIINHSQFFILVDHQSMIRGYYPALNIKSMQKIRDDMQWLLDQQYPDRATDIPAAYYPKDVADPPWLAERAESQKKAAESYSVKHDFQFSDQLSASGITFKDEVVEDVKRTFKAAHYDHGSGVAVADVDGDGKLDVYFVSQLGRNELWRNLGDGKFEDITEAAGVGVPKEVGVGASFADIDNDGDADLYVTRVRAPNKLFINDGSGKFADASEKSGLDHLAHSSGSVFFDYDKDGLLDVLLTNVGKYTTERRAPGGFYTAHKAAFTGHLHEDRHEENILYRNLGEGKFENVNEQVGFDDESWTGDATPIDANDDGWTDIYLLNMQGHDEYWENQEGKKFVKKSRELFPVTAWGTMGVKVFDYNRDGKLDLYVTDMHTDMVHDLGPNEEKSKMRKNLPINALATDGNHILGNAFFRKDGPSKYVEVSDEIGAENYWPWGISVADLNADGFEDVFIAASMSYPFRYGINSILLNDGETFLDSEFVLGIEPRSKGSAQKWMVVDCDGADIDCKVCADHTGRVLVWSAIGTRSSVIFDVDGDGDLDIVTNDFGGTPSVLISNLQDDHNIHYLQVALQGTESNRDGLGAMVTVHSGDKKMIMQHDGKSGYLSQSRIPLYFGLADAAQVDRIEVVWPSGAKQTVEGPIQANQTLTIAEEESATDK